jgi:sirohydrochlorin cobaltochelatase
VTSPILLGHGSPDPTAQSELAQLGNLVAERLGRNMGLGVLEFPAPNLPTLDEAFAMLDGEGSIAAQPLILFEGRHGRYDIPALVERAAARLGREIRVGAALGSDPVLLDLVSSRLNQVGPQRGDILLFVGRGSSEPLALRQCEEVAASLAQRIGLDHIICYTGISRPNLAEGMALALQGRPQRVLALPYLLHTGILVRRVSEVLTPLASQAEIELEVLPHIGNAEPVVDLIASRLETP